MYFEKKFTKLNLDHVSYSLFDLNEISEVEELFEDSSVAGFNVTIPYKEAVIDYLDELSEEARTIGAVNCVKIENGIKKGFNTDAYGFERTLDIHLQNHHQSAIVLGDGGAAKAVQFVLKKKQIPAITVSRKSEFTFENLTKDQVEKNLLIVQCTPVGTFPNVEDSVKFPFEGISEKHLVIDLIYNPEYTKFLSEAAARGAQTANGFYMLEQQAEKAWEIWEVQKK
jgi:shikimate dehydrogenase